MAMVKRIRSSLTPKAMILGMNPKSLRQSLHWNLFMWPKKHHWALVVQPAEDFPVRIVPWQRNGKGNLRPANCMPPTRWMTLPIPHLIVLVARREGIWKFGM